MGLLGKFRFRFRLNLALFLLITTVLIGTIGYMVIEGLSFIDSLYMTIITVSTVGFGEVKSLSENGRLFTILLIVGNIGIFTYAVSIITQVFLDGELRQEYRKYTFQKKLSRMKGHTIVCGFGRNGQQACRELSKHNIPFVVVEHNPIDETLYQFEINHIKGDARQDHVLLEARIEDASALITTLPEDAANVFVVITARYIKPNLKIISRASDDSSEVKLRRAGANNIIMPDKVGGAHMAYLVTKPDVMEFIDIITGQRDREFQISELNFDLINEKYQNKTIAELDIRNKTGANIIGFKKSNGEYVINPQADNSMTSHCKLIVLGTEQQIKNLEEYYYS